MTLIIRNAFGGAYAAYNSHFAGADMVFAMPMARIAVMGAGAASEFVYKDEIRALDAELPARRSRAARPKAEARRARDAGLAQLARALRARADEPEGGALARLGVAHRDAGHEPARARPRTSNFLMRTYTPSPMGGPQREFE